MNDQRAMAASPVQGRRYKVFPENIPQELKALPQWLVWKPIEKTNEKGEVKVAKPPYQSRCPMVHASSTDRATWSTFEEAIDCYNNDTTIGGIGFVFTKEDPYFGIDLDDTRDMPPEDLEQRKRLESQIHENMQTYCEVSPSGNGYHWIAIGKLPSSNNPLTRLKGEIDGSDRYFTMTGNVVSDKYTITEQQEFIDLFGFKAREKVNVADVHTNRPQNLTDQQVIEKATKNKPSFGPRFRAESGHLPTEWSKSLYALIAELDRITGSNEQIKRIMSTSPFVINSPPSNANQSRTTKFARIFEDVLSKVRVENNSSEFFAEHGRQQAENIARFAREKAESNMEEPEASESEHLEKDKLSDNAITLLDTFNDILTFEHRELTRPPGSMGAFVLANENASWRPLTKYAIPTTFTVLSGILGRRYKIDGSGLDVHFVVTGNTGTGKTQALNAWTDFILQAQKRNSPRPKNRILAASTMSIQGIISEFLETPSLAWFVDEAEGQMQTVLDAQTNNDKNLKGAFLKLFDASKHGHEFSAPKSVASTSAGIKPINNLNVSTLWQTTPGNFNIMSKQVQDGLVSRLSIVQQSGFVSKQKQPIKELTVGLAENLCQMMIAADVLDTAYKNNPISAEHLLVHIKLDDEALAVFDRLDFKCEELLKAASTGELPEVYAVINRLMQQTQRIAALCAAVQSASPQVTAEQIRWAFGYLLQNLAELFSRFDTGEAGEKQNDAIAAVVNVYNKTIAKPGNKRKYREGIRRAEFRNALKDSKIFQKLPLSADKTITETWKIMLEEGQLTEDADSFGTKRLKPNFEAACWRRKK